MEDKDQPGTSDRLRKDIDSRVGSDEAAPPDPAASPLEADEPSRAPPTAEEIALDAAAEEPGRSTTDMASSATGETRAFTGRAVVIALFAFAAVIALLALLTR